MENKNTRKKNTKRKNTRRKNTRRKNTRRKNTRRKNTRRNTRRSRVRNTRRSRVRKKKKLKGGVGFITSDAEGTFYISDRIKCQIKRNGDIGDWDVRITLNDKKLVMDKNDPDGGNRVNRTADLRDCTVSDPKQSRGEDKHWLRVDLKENDHPTYSGRKFLKNRVKKYIFGFDTVTEKLSWKNMFELASLNERVEDEIVIPYSDEGIQRLADLLKETVIQSGKTKHTVVIMGHHSMMREGNYYIPDGIEIIVKASIGHFIQKYIDSTYLDQHVMYQYFNSINRYITNGEIVGDDGCVNPELEYALTYKNTLKSDVEDVNVKISGKSDGRQELPDVFKDGLDPKQQLTYSEMNHADIDPEVLRQYYANNVNMVFTDERFYAKHGLLFEVQEPGKEKYKVRLLLVTPEELSEFQTQEDEDDEHYEDRLISGRVMETLKKLRELTEHEFAVFFAECRGNASELHKELSSKTDKSIDCWLKWYHDDLIDMFTDGMGTEAEQLFTELSGFLKKNFSSMNDVYNNIRETLKNILLSSELLLSGDKKEIIGYILFSCFLHFMRFGDFEESFFRKIIKVIPESFFNNEDLIRISLFESLFKGHLEITKFLLEKGANKEAKNSSGETSLLVATRRGHLDIVKLLLEKDANIEAKNQHEYTPLLMAIQRGHLEIVQLLLEKDANIEAKNRLEYTPLLLAIQRNEVEIAKLLVEMGANKEYKDKNGMTPLLRAVEINRLDIAGLLLGEGANIEAQTEKGETSLLVATQKGHLGVVKLLLEGANKEAKNSSGETSLLVATQKGQLEIVELLVDANVDIESVNGNGDTPLIIATQEGHLEIVQLLLEKGANKEYKNKNGMTPLLRATQEGHLEIVQLLVEKGADIENDTSSEYTPLMVASIMNRKEIVEFLLEKGANKEAKNIYGMTPLLFASIRRRLDIVELLLEKGANIEAKTKDGSTSLSLATERGKNWEEIKQYLEQHLEKQNLEQRHL